MDALLILLKVSKVISDFFVTRLSLTFEPRRMSWISKISLSMSAAILGLLLVCLPASAQTSILTQHYDNSRTGQNTAETILTTPNVNSSSFGKLFWIPVDGYVYAQPLYVSGVTIPGKGIHNVLYIATEHDSLYAVDADNGAPLWNVSYLINGATTLSTNDVGSTQDINPEMGITGTPTIDPTTNTLYVVVNTKEGTNIIYRLHAVDITSGAEKFGGPVLMSASVPGSAPDGNGSTVPFNPQWANQRPGLLLLNGFVYVGFGSHGDNGPWHGWILAYNATTLSQTGAWCTSPNGKGNGIWAAGSGLTADAAGNIYVATGNGDDTVTVPAPPPSTTIDYGDSIVRLGLTNGVPVPTDYFTPWNQASLGGADTDLGSGGVLALPDQPGPFPHILIQAGKQGEIYVINRDQLTSDGSHYCNGCTSDPEIIQPLAGTTGGLWSMPAYWNGQIYMWGNGGHLVAYSLTNGRLSQSPTSSSAELSNYPGSTPVVSSSGATNGIVWAVESAAYTTSGPAILRAYSATNVSNLLYASNLTAGRDTLGHAVKFVVPVVANGRVYVGAQKEVDVFGLTAGWPQTAAPTFNPLAGSYAAGVQVAIGSTTANASIFYTTDGSIPTGTSTLYIGPVTATATTTFNAVAIANGFLQSALSTATFTIQAQTSSPDFSPIGGTYSSAQTVQLSDTTPNATIYYTTDGTTPTQSSQQYTTPIAVTSASTITAIASSPGLNDSPLTAATYTINPNATVINFGIGFATPTGLQFNGSTDLDDSRLQLTNGGTNEAGSAFYTTPVDVAQFTTDFTFQLSAAQADGMTFTIQNSSAGATALGPSGGGLGYGPDTPGGTPGISNSVAVKFDLYSNDGEGEDSTGLYTNGASPTVPATDMTSSGVILNNGDTMSVHITYDGATLTMTITDFSANATFSKSWPINIPQTIGGNTAFVGFAAGTGGLTASQKIETWTFVSTPSGTSQVQTPVIMPGSESFSGTVSVSITDATSGSAIYYTTDGTAPMPGQGTAKQYTTAFTLSSSATVNAIATASGDTNSATATATYTLIVATPVIIPGSQSFSGTVSVSITDSTSGSAIYYTTDGTTPIPGQGTTKQYTTPFTLSSTATVKAIATAPGDTSSTTTTATYTLVVATPVIIPGSESFSGTLNVSITDPTSGSTIYYTTDGSAPVPGQGTTKQYLTALTLSSTTTVNAMATAPGDTNSPTAAAAYTFVPSQPTATPTITPKGGKISTTQPISITDATTGAAIFFTTDGSTPSPGVGTTQQYGTPFILPASATVKAIATASGFATSVLSAQTFTVPRVVVPVLTPTGGAILTTQTVSITDGTSGAAIYFTTDGTTPSPSTGTTQQYLAPFTLSSPATVKAIATESGYQASALGSATYTFQKASPPVVTPKNGTIGTTQTINLTDTTTGAAIFYTTDGTAPTPGQGTAQQFRVPFTLSASGPVKAIAIATGYLNSALTTTSFTLQRASSPTFTPTGGAVSSTQPITLTNTTTGAVIYYTTDGSAPSPGMGTTKQYGSPFTLPASATVKTIALAPGYMNSAMAQANYTVH
jgi:heme/copper-type cytochrome/quinol oxidase subunit 4